MNLNKGEVLSLDNKNYEVVNRLRVSDKDIAVIKEENNDVNKYLLIGEDGSLQEITDSSFINTINEQVIDSIDDIKSIIDEAIDEIDEY